MKLSYSRGLKDGLYGLVNLGTTPFRIELNDRVVPVRKFISLIHEMLHIWTTMNKIRLSHNNLHRIAVGIHNDLLPVITQLKSEGEL